MSEAAMSSAGSHTDAGESHGLSYPAKVGRARSAVFFFILSDIMMVASIMAAGGYLNALNTAGAFKADGDQPLLAPGLVVAIMLVLSGLCYFGWYRGFKRGSSMNAVYMVGLLFLLASLVAEIWVWTSLGYTTDPTAAPAYDAFRSMVILVTAFSTFHLVTTSIVGILMAGRLTRGRLAGHEYIAEVTGYWWYYTVISGLLVWLFIVIL